MNRLLEATARAERDHFWFRGFRAFVKPALATATGGRRCRILDCGAGTGANLLMLRAFGSAVGVDLTWTGLAFAHARGERRIAQASAIALPFPGHSFDLVTSFDMLQCVPDDGAALAEMRRVLRPGGHLVITVAAMRLLWGNHSILAREVRRYGRGELRDRLALAGFEPRRVTYTNATLFPILAPLRIAQRVRGLALSDEDARAEQEIAVPPRAVNAIMIALLAAEAAVVRVANMPFGSSLLAVARAV
jgi:ubiquinone/menaquinone biosynthesis C-methylase UbiE